MKEKELIHNESGQQIKSSSIWYLVPSCFTESAAQLSSSPDMHADKRRCRNWSCLASFALLFVFSSKVFTSIHISVGFDARRYERCM